MLKQIEGSAAVAQAVAAARPQVVCAYPISPQTHIVEGLSRLVAAGKLPGCQYINVESEFGAMSVAIGACAAGARVYTATASQGLLFMVEAVYNAAGLELPIVMTVANRAIGAPINIWNDHSDAMSQRDSGWIQLYAASNQEAVDLHVQAFRIAETVNVPVMVCMDGYVLTHAVERVDVPEPEAVDAFLPPRRAQVVLDPDRPMTIGTMVGPEAFEEVRYLAYQTHQRALGVIADVAAEFTTAFGRASGGLVHPYRTQDAETVVVALGSAFGTLSDVVDERREAGEPVGALALTTFRPFPYAEVRAALEHARHVIVLERALPAGGEPPVTTDVRAALAGTPAAGMSQTVTAPSAGPGRPAGVTRPGPAPASSPQLSTVVGGLGGRAITKASLHRMLDAAEDGSLEPLHFLDLNLDLVSGGWAQ